MNTIVSHDYGRDFPYHNCYELMRQFTEARTPGSKDNIWFAEHPSVFTLGLNSNTEHLLTQTTRIPVIKTDRGGQITYHGPGQLLIYFLFDLKRLQIGVKTFVHTLEQIVIDLLAVYDLPGERMNGAPGVYVEGNKIAALGIRVKQGRCYHGLSLNYAMDLTPYQHINPCGYPDLKVTQLRDFGIDITRQELMVGLEHQISRLFHMKIDHTEIATAELSINLI